MTSPTKSSRSISTQSKRIRNACDGLNAGQTNRHKPETSDITRPWNIGGLMGPPKSKPVCSAKPRKVSSNQAPVVRPLESGKPLSKSVLREPYVASSAKSQKTSKLDQSFLSSPFPSNTPLSTNLGRSIRPSKTQYHQYNSGRHHVHSTRHQNTTLLEGKLHQKEKPVPSVAATMCLSQGLDQSYYNSPPSNVLPMNTQPKHDSKHNSSLSMNQSATESVISGQSVVSKTSNKHGYHKNSNSSQAGSHDISNTTKLVDYSLSPIAPSGSVMCYPHSVHALSPVYKASTRRYRDPISPLHSDSMEYSATSQWQGSQHDTRSYVGGPECSDLSISRSMISEASVSGPARDSSKHYFFHAENEDEDNSLAGILGVADNSKSSPANPFEHLFAPNDSAANDPDNDEDDGSDIMAKLFGKQQQDDTGDDESYTDELVQRILTQAQQEGDNSSNAALSQSRSSNSFLKSPPAKLRIMANDVGSSSASKTRDEELALHEAKCRDRRVNTKRPDPQREEQSDEKGTTFGKPDELPNMNKTMRELADITDSTEKDTTAGRSIITSPDKQEQPTDKQATTVNKNVTIPMSELKKSPHVENTDHMPSGDLGGLSPIIASSFHHKSLVADYSADESLVLQADNITQQLIGKEGPRDAADVAPENTSSKEQTTVSTSAELVNTESGENSTISSKKKSVTFRNSQLEEEIKTPTNRKNLCGNRRLIDSILDNTVVDSRSSSDCNKAVRDHSLSESHHKTISQSDEEGGQQMGLLEDLLSQSNLLERETNQSQKATPPCFSSIKIEPF